MPLMYSIRFVDILLSFILSCVCSNPAQLHPNVDELRRYPAFWTESASPSRMFQHLATESWVTSENPLALSCHTSLYPIANLQCAIQIHARCVKRVCINSEGEYYWMARNVGARSVFEVTTCDGMLERVSPGAICTSASHGPPVHCHSLF